jgi:calcineurin-like phosphoesterase family protein
VNNLTGKLEYGNDIDPRYFNVSVECIDFSPISFEEVNKRILNEGGHVGFKKSNIVVM